MTTAIAVENVSKQFKLGQSHGSNMLREVLMNTFRSALRKGEPEEATTLWALREINFQLKAGEVLGIVGRNGAGKSTLLKILSRITRPTSGAIHVRGKVASLLEVGTGFHEELTGRENVYLSGCILGMTKRRIDAKLDEIIAFSEIERFIDTPIKRYSSGMKMRLGFSVAANLESDILIVDEVLAVGDGEFQRKCLRAMSELHSSGRTVIFVSHNLAAVHSLCSRGIWIDRGRVKEEGRPADVIASYMATFSTTEDVVRDLDEVVDRSGSGDIRFTRIEILTADRAGPATVCCGESFVVRLHFDAKRDVVQPIFGINIQTSLGIIVTQVHTYNNGFEIPLLRAGPGYIEVKIDDLNLVPGRYVLSLYVANYGDIYHDVLPNCAALEVQTSNRYGLMRGMTKNPIVMFACSWQMGDRLSGPFSVPAVAALAGSRG
ncbi:MAG TPA: ABC transporter ATP-binding protein [Gemmatimonadaceae bacterium]|nr:ABC transporter ATP-binding protein [Gemmatimonadaceae bacterium]